MISLLLLFFSKPKVNEKEWVELKHSFLGGQTGRSVHTEKKKNLENTL